MNGPVLDASAVLALIRNEPGAAQVASRLDGAVLSTVNLAEVLSKHVDHGLDPRPVARDLSALGVEFAEGTEEDAVLQAVVRARDPGVGGQRLSLADRLCLALGLRLEREVLTADRLMTQVVLPIEVTLLR